MATSQVDAQQTVTEPTEATLIGTSPYLGGGLTTDGRWVVYSGSADLNGRDFDVFGIDLATGEEFDIATGPGSQSSPNVDGDYVVWYVLTDERQAIDAMYLPTREVFTVSAAQYGNYDPKISGDWVIWQHYSDDRVKSLLARNMRTMEPVQQIHTFPGGDNEPSRIFTRLDDGRVLLYEVYDFLLDPNTWVDDWRMSIFDLTTGGSRAVVAGQALYDYLVDDNGHEASLIVREGTVPPNGFAFADSTLVYQEWRTDGDLTLIAQDVDTGERREIAWYPTPFDQYDEFGSPVPGIYMDRWNALATDGRLVFWVEHEVRDFGYPSTIQGFDLESGVQMAVVQEREAMYWPDSFFIMEASNEMLVWAYHGELAPRYSDIAVELHAAQIADLVPEHVNPALPVPPRVDAPTLRYFAETGHILRHRFLEFWELNGGLPVFGFPLTEKFWEASDASDTRIDVQYFERQRFEWHPEHAGTPYEILLGRLGYDDAAERRLLESEPFQPRPVDAVVPSNCTSFDETQHLICDDFDGYWSSHGLELGDLGVSYRESIALFGYPLSEAFVDPATGLLTQYFERAVFELHPDNEPEYRVLLRRLGADRLPEFGLN